jgi:hypothetical protein
MKLPRPVRSAYRNTDETVETVETSTRQSAMSGLSRRVLLTRGSLTMVAAGVASAMPALPALVTASEAEAPDAQATVAETDSLAAPLIAQVKNLQTGEVSLYSGEREISIIDRGLAARLFNAAR